MKKRADSPAPRGLPPQPLTLWRRDLAFQQIPPQPASHARQSRAKYQQTSFEERFLLFPTVPT